MRYYRLNFADGGADGPGRGAAPFPTSTRAWSRHALEDDAGQPVENVAQGAPIVLDVADRGAPRAGGPGAS